MTVNYAVNSTTITTVNRCQWQPNRIYDQYSNVAGYSGWYTHVWLVDRMNMLDYEFLDSLKGTTLLELVSTDKDAPSNEKTYTSARLLNISGRHVGLNMESVRVEFLADTG